MDFEIERGQEESKIRGLSAALRLHPSEYTRRGPRIFGRDEMLFIPLKKDKLSETVERAYF